MTTPQSAAAIAAALGNFDPPVMLIAPHTFSCIAWIPCCAVCGGGILHEVHAEPLKFVDGDGLGEWLYARGARS